MIDYLVFEGVNGQVFTVDQVMDLPLSAFETVVETRNDENVKTQLDGIWPEYDYLGRRTWHIEGDLIGTDPGNYWQRRMDIQGIFEPRPDLGFLYTVRLRVKFTGIGEEVISYCNLDGMPELPLAAMNPSISNCLINLKAADPRLYGSIIQTFTTDNPVVSGGRTFNKHYNFTYGASSSGGVASLANSGNTKTYPQITMYGPCDSPQAQVFDAHGNLHMFSLAGYSLGAADWVTVDFRARTVTDDGGQDVSAFMQPGSEWLYLEPGTNNTRFVGFNSTTACHAVWQWQNAYLL